MNSQYKESLEFTLSELKSGMQIAKEDIFNFSNKNIPYFTRGFLSTFFSIIPFQERHEYTSTNIPRRTNVYYTSRFEDMNKKEKILSAVGASLSLGMYYGVGFSKGYSIEDLMVVHAFILLSINQIAISRKIG